MAMPMLKGKERNFWVVLLLSIVTFGIYGIVWTFKAHDELIKQWKTGDFPILWFILLFVPFIGLIAWFVYMSKFFGTLHTVRGKLGLGQGFSYGGYLLWSIPGILLLGLGPLIALYKLQGSINECWRKAGTSAPPAPRPAWTPTATPPR